jgi:hypothetical protein
VEAAHAQHRRLQVVEGALGDPGGDLRAGAVEDRGLVHHDQPAGALHRRLHGVEVDRRHRAQVHDLQAAALVRGGSGGLQADLDHRPVGGERQVGALLHHGRLVQVAGDRRGVDLALVPVAALGLEEDHRVVALDGLLEHPVGVVGVGRRDHFQAGDVREQRLRGLAVVLHRADPAAVGDAHHDRQLDLAEGAGVHLGELGDDLVVGREDEAVELDLHHRAVAAQRQADRGADDAGLGQRGVDDAALAEVLVQAVGDAEHTAEAADVLAHDEDLGVVLQRLAQRLVEGLGQWHPGHGQRPFPCAAAAPAACGESPGSPASPASSKESRYSANAARSSSTSACPSA